MELENLANRRIENDDAIALAKAWIQPLPEDVEPSQEFLRRTRLQLLKLPRPEPSRSQQQAA
jgi:hypothetical protein